MTRKTQYLSKETPRIDGIERVTGQARYTEDVYLPGMLFARVLRSPLPHAHIRKIDVSAAEALPGVRAILHSANNDTIWASGDRLGRRHIFSKTVRFVGEAVAVVAAVNRDVAEDALHLIRVDYEALPFNVRVEDAIKEDAPKLFAEGNSKPNDPEIAESGDLEEGFRQADFVYENDFITKHQNNAQLERRASIAQWDGDRLTVWTSTQGMYLCRGEIAKSLQLPQSKVRVVCQYMGSGFGGKIVAYDFDLMAALLAKRSGRPVRVEYSRHEDFVAVHGRWSTRQHYRVGVKKDGTITAFHMKGTSGMGAYLRAPGSGGIMSHQPYLFPNVRTEVTRVHTNSSCGANFRAPTGPQGAFAIESALDDIAVRLGIDPVEFRLRHIVRDVWGPKKNRLTSNGLPECIRLGAEAIGWTEKRKAYTQQKGAVRRGVGMGVACWGASVNASGAGVRIFPDGSVEVSLGLTDIGTGAKTAMGLIAAEALGIPLAAISVVGGETDLVPYSQGESGSNATGATGIALIEAARQVREQLLEQAAARLNARREDLDVRGGRIVDTVTSDRSWAIAEVTANNLEPIAATVTTHPSDGVLPNELFVRETLISASTSDPLPEPDAIARAVFAAHFAEVEVNLETGKVRVLRYTAAHDSGTIINKLTAGSQVKGGVAQGIGMALREELILDRHTGVPVNNYYHGAKPLLHPETPEVEVIWVETDDPFGPFGAKSLGEMPIVPVVGAVANAIFHATGLRICELPITPDKILAAWEEGKKA